MSDFAEDLVSIGLQIAGFDEDGADAFAEVIVEATKYAIRQSRKGVDDPNQARRAIRQSVPVRRWAFGRVRLSGAYMCYERWERDSIDILAIHDGEIDAFEQFYLHDDAVTIDSSGWVQEIVPGRYKPDLIEIKTRTGLSTETAFSEATSRLDLWTDDHRGDGIAQIYMRCKPVDADKFSTRYPNGLPEPSAVIRARKDVFDPRTGLEAWTLNPICQTITFLCDSEKGPGLSYEDILEPYEDELSDEADICEEQVALKAGGTHSRYECSFSVEMDAPYIDTLEELLRSYDGFLAPRGDGTLKLQAGKYRTPTVTINPENIIDLTVDRGRNAENRVNTITSEFTSPAHDYATMQADSWVDSLSVSAYGKQAASFPVISCQHHARWRRLAKREAVRLFSELSGSARVDASGFDVLSERYIYLDLSEDLPSVGKIAVEVIDPVIYAAAMEVAFRWVLADPEVDAWNALAEEGAAPPLPDVTEPSGLIPPSGVAATARYASGLAYIDVSFDEPDEDYLTFAVRFRIDNGGGSYGPWQTVEFSEWSAASGTVTLTIGPVTGGVDYEIGVASKGSTAAYSDWSDSVTANTDADATPPGVPTGFTGSAGGGLVSLAATAPTQANTASLQFYRGGSADDFADASPLGGRIACNPSETITYGDTPGVGTWKYWVRAYNTSGIAGDPAGPETETIS